MKRALLCTVLCVFVAAVSLTANAVDYPTRPVRVIVGLTAGSGVDVMARIVGQKLAEATGQPFIIENRPGAGSNIATVLPRRPPPTAIRFLSRPSPTQSMRRFTKICSSTCCAISRQ